MLIIKNDKRGRPSATMLEKAYQEGRKAGYQEAQDALLDAMEFVRWKSAATSRLLDGIRGTEGERRQPGSSKYLEENESEAEDPSGVQGLHGSRN